MKVRGQNQTKRNNNNKAENNCLHVNNVNKN